MRIYRSLVIIALCLFPCVLRADCIAISDPIRPAGTVLPQAQTCGENVTANGNSVIFVQIPQLPIFTAAQINTADLSKGPGLIVGCGNCAQCRICASTGSIVGQTGCVGSPGGNGVGCR